MLKETLTYQNSTINYLSFGEGSHLLIAFHGFADRANLFTVLAPALGNRFTVVAFDLPYHGDTLWEKQLFTKYDLINIVEQFCLRYQAHRLSFMGFSFGGRIALSLLEHFQERLDYLFLIAPDGFDTKWMFNMETTPRFFRRFIFWILEKPAWLMKLVELLFKGRIISRFIRDFIINHVNTKERRDRIFCVWLSIDAFKVRKKKTFQLMNSGSYPVFLFFGTRDEVIPVNVGKGIVEKVPKAQLFEIEEGHRLVDEKLTALLKKLIL